MLSVPAIIQLAKPSQYLASNAIEENIEQNNILDIEIYIERRCVEWAYNQSIYSQSAIGDILISGMGSQGDIFTVYDKQGGSVIGTYTVQSAHEDQNVLANNISISINNLGYSASSYNNDIRVKAPLALGNTVNGNDLYMTYTPFFLPQSLTGFWAGYESDSGVTVSGSDVLSWAEITGQTSKDLAAFAGSPTLVPNVLNGLPVLNTDGVTGRLLGTNLPQITDCTIYMVALQKSGDTSNGLFIGSGNDLNISRDGGGNDIVGRTVNPSQNVPVNVMNDVFYSIRLSGDLTTQDICKNNGTPTSASRTHTTITPTNLNIFYDGTGFVSSKQIAAIWIFLATHTTGQKNQMEAYLNSKYNLY